MKGRRALLGVSEATLYRKLDQYRLKQGLYRHPWDDILYMTPKRAKEKETQHG